MSRNQEVVLNESAFLVSETDAKGNILFANDEFCNVVGYTFQELIGQPHSLVRHSDMPKVAFQDLWDTVKKDEVWYGFVKNKTKLGGYYWVSAAVYPYKNESGDQCYISIRRKASNADIKTHEELYIELKRKE